MGVLEGGGLEVRNRVLRVLSMLCLYFEESFTVLFDCLAKHSPKVDPKKTSS